MDIHDKYAAYDLPDYKGVETSGMPPGVIKDSRSYKENEAMVNPAPGDHWENHDGFNLFVVKTTPRLVWVASAIGDFQPNFQIDVFNRDQYNAYMRHGGKDRFTGIAPWRPTADIFHTLNRSRFCLVERGLNVDGWLDFAIKNNRVYVEHTHV